MYLTPVNLINMCLGMFLLRFILYGTLCFLDLGDYFLPHIREVFEHILFKYFLRSFSSSPSETHDSTVGAFNVVPEVSKTVVT